MPPLLATWNALDLRRRVVVALAAVAMLVAVLGLARLATAPSFALLYAGMEAGAAGEVVSALEQRGVAYQVRGDSIYVDAGQRDAVRMTLAAEGLPAPSAAGYELLDHLSGFATTSQMFDAAYLRAREGELARTIVASARVRAARVHIAAQGTGPFRPSLAPSASVSLTPASGAIGADQARAVRYLVGAAVAGLRPEDVAVIDAASGQVIGADAGGAGPAAGADRAEALRAAVTRLIEARVGSGAAVVEVAVEPSASSESLTERRFDPTGRVAISSEIDQRTNTSSGTAGAVTVASNLPEGGGAGGRGAGGGATGAGAAGGGGTPQSRENETRERTNYEVSETLREVQTAAGGVARITVAVLVDGLREVGPDGTETWAPRPPEELQSLEALVASAVGFDAARGDVITLRTMRLDVAPTRGTLVEAGMFDVLDPMRLAQIGVLAAVTLVLGLFVVRPIVLAPPRPAAAASLPAPGAGRQALTGEIADEGGAFGLPAVVSADAGADPGETEDDPVARLRRLIESRRDETAEILRGWMEEREDREETA